MLDRSGAAVRTRRLSKRCGFSTSTRAAYKLLLAGCDRRQYEYVEYKGYNGSVVIESDGLMIRREGLSRAMSAASPSRWVPLTAISDVSLHPSTRLTNGWITLGVMGNAARQLGAGTAASDPDTILFRHRDAEMFAALHDWLRSVIRVNSAGSSNRMVPSLTDAAQENAGPGSMSARVEQQLPDQAANSADRQTTSATTEEPASHQGAWHPDPLGRFQLRFWDGRAWTDHVSSNGVMELDTVDGPQVDAPKAGSTSSQDEPAIGEPKSQAAAHGFFQRRREEKAAKASARDAFGALAMRAAQGDLTALSLLSTETRNARSLYGASDLERRRLDLLSSAVRIVIEDDVLTEAEDAHIERLLNALEVSESQLWSSAPELAEELAIARINAGRLPTVPHPQIILKSGEVCRATFPASLMKDVAIRQYRGASSSVSIPLGAGMRYRVGGVRRRTVIVGTETVVGDTGSLSITSNRCVFTGRAKTLEFRHDRLVNLEQFQDGLRLSVSNRQTPSLFRLSQGTSPAVAAALISACVRSATG